MKKKVLEGMPELLVTDQMRKTVAADPPVEHKTWFGTTESRKYHVLMRCIVKGGVLKVALFWSEYISAGSKKPIFEVYISKEEGKFSTFDVCRDKWSEAMLDNLQWPKYVTSHEIWATSRDDARIKNYLGGTRRGAYRVLEYQKQLRAEALKRRYQKELDVWDADLARVPPLPKDWEHWVDKVGIAENFIYYHYKKGGATTGYCTYCGKEVPISQPHHNQEGRCVKCRHAVVFKAMGRAGIHITRERIVFLLQRCQGGFILRKFSVERIYQPKTYENSKLIINEYRRVIYNKDFTSRTYCYQLYKDRVQYRWCCVDNYDEWREPWRGPIYGRTLPDLAKKELRYSGFPEVLRDNLVVHLDPETYMDKLTRAPILEKLAKAELPRLTIDVFDGRKIVIGEGTTLTQMLGIDSQQLARLRKNNWGAEALRWLQFEKGSGQGISDENIAWFVENDIQIEKLNFIRDRMSILSIINYVKRHIPEEKMTCHEVLYTWADYLAMAGQLGIDTSDEIIYKPRRLKKRHDDLVERINEKNLEVQAVQVAEEYPHVNEICRTLQAKYGYTEAVFTILAPTCVLDIMHEGRALSHCVGNERYWERIERRESFVLFLRRTSEPDKPYYTLEIEPDGTVRQKRSKFDRQYADIAEAKQFLQRWQREVTKRLTAEDHKLAKSSRVQRTEELSEMIAKNVRIQGGALAGQPLAQVLMDDLMENKEAA